MPPNTTPPTTIDFDDTIEEFLEDLLDRFDADGDTFEELRLLLEQIINDF
jgi:hypothetical protein